MTDRIGAAPERWGRRRFMSGAGYAVLPFRETPDFPGGPGPGAVVRSSHVVDRSRTEFPGHCRCRHVLSLLLLTSVSVAP